MFICSTPWDLTYHRKKDKSFREIVPLLALIIADIIKEYEEEDCIIYNQLTVTTSFKSVYLKCVAKNKRWRVYLSNTANWLWNEEVNLFFIKTLLYN